MFTRYDTRHLQMCDFKGNAPFLSCDASLSCGDNIVLCSGSFFVPIFRVCFCYLHCTLSSVADLRLVVMIMTASHGEEQCCSMFRGKPTHMVR